jgi:hypothetical protein
LRLPNHVILDFNNQHLNYTSSYWVNDLSTHELSNSPFFFKNKILSNKLNSSANYLDGNVQPIRGNFLLNLQKVINNPSQNLKLNTLNNLINTNFIRKERLYTKLKYSRSPAFDIVSGGAAAIFAGLLGFLVSEKFGFELVDSGDFYYLFMYGVFLAFSVRPLLVVMSHDRSFLSLISLKRVILFYKNILILLIKLFK